MAVVRADSTLHADELEPGDEIYLWDVGWDMRHHLPNVWNWCKGDERHRALREPARVARVDRKSTRLNSSHLNESRMPSSA